jgi:phage gp45-like
MIRGIVNQVKEGLIKIFSASGRTDETLEEREYFQHYGFTSRPLSGAEIIIINEGNHFIAIASDDRNYRIAIEDGEVALYTDEGDKIHLKRERKIEITSGAEVQVNSPIINLGGDRDSIKYLVDERLINWLVNHTHSTGPVPAQPLTIADVCTTITKAG